MFTPNRSNLMAPATRGATKQTMLDAPSRPKSRATQKNAATDNPGITKEKNKRRVVEQWKSTSGSEDGLPDVDEDTSADSGASQHTISSADDGRVFLQREVLIGSDEGLDLDNMVSALAQILLMKGMPAAARHCVIRCTYPSAVEIRARQQDPSQCNGEESRCHDGQDS